METPALTPQQRYRHSEKCRLARERYYLSKGKAKAHEYYERNKQVILNRSKERYHQLKAEQENNLGNDLN